MRPGRGEVQETVLVGSAARCHASCAGTGFLGSPVGLGRERGSAWSTSCTAAPQVATGDSRINARMPDEPDREPQFEDHAPTSTAARVETSIRRRRPDTA
jgi:hypothetical protein